MNVSDIARVCHEVNRAYCHALGDPTQCAWKDAPDWQKQSAVNGVAFHLANPDAGPEGSHDNWVNDKVKAGWIYGPERLPEEKEHPCIMEFEMLPKEQQAKDYIFAQIVHSMKLL